MSRTVFAIPAGDPITGEDIALDKTDVFILFNLSSGCRAKEVAKNVVLSVKTINHRIERLYDKTGCKTHSALVCFAFIHKILVIKEGKAIIAINMG